MVDVDVKNGRLQVEGDERIVHGGMEEASEYSLYKDGEEVVASAVVVVTDDGDGLGNVSGGEEE